MDNEEALEQLKPGTQILYVPNHASGDENHPSVEAGFVTSVRADGEIAWCRYFVTIHPQSTLRTRVNSEATPTRNIVVKNTRPQTIVDAKLTRILEEQAS